MKKLLLSLALVLCFTAARAGGFGISLGPKIGYQTATLSLKKIDMEYSFKNSWTAGVFVRAHFGAFVIQPELMYFKSEKVFNLEGVSLTNFDPKITLNQQNLSLPIYLGYMLDGSLLKARFYAGPVAYFLVGQKQSDNNDGILNVKDIEAKKITWGAAINVGIDVWRLTLDISYSLGLSNLFGQDDVNWSFGNSNGTIHLDNTKQNMFMVTLGFRLLD
ncbi:MAG: PorT family protein [Bacteroidales bacterium]|nr:PorT family protein [Bacteroidales bacterium]